MRRVALALLLACFSATLATAERRALIIGNADYDDAPDLQNTLADAAAYSDVFAALGYEVTLLKDLGRDDLEVAVAVFTDSIEPGDDAIFVFSGHGWSDGQVNYLLPTDIPTSASKKLTQLRSMPLQNGVNGVLDQMKAAGASLQVAIIDACRNNIFDPQGTKSFGQTRGLSRVQPAEGAFVIFSAGAGQTALDRLPTDQGEDLSVFTRTFLPHLRAGKPLLRAMKAAQQETVVLARSIGHPQRPAFYDETLGDVCLAGECAVTPVAQPDICGEARAVWGDVKDSGSAVILKGFAQKYAQCPIYAGLAQSALEQIATAAPALTPKAKEVEVVETTEVDPPVTTTPAALTTAEKICLNLAAPPQTVEGIEGVALADVKANTAIAACEKSLERGSDRVDIHHALARALFAQKNYDLARARFAIPAGRGYVPSMTSLGALHFNGLGGKRDYDKAYALFDATAEAGDGLGLFYRGFARQGGRGTPVASAKAGQDFLEAIKRGNQFAMDNLRAIKAAPMKEIQSLLKRDGHYPSTVDGKLGPGTRAALGMVFASLPAHETLMLASTDADADFQRGMDLIDGRGVLRDVAQGIGLLRRAAEAGHSDAQTEVGKIYSDGRLTQRNDALAAQFLRQAVAQGHGEAHFLLAVMHEYGRSLPKDAARAGELYYRALAKGDGGAIRTARFLSDDVMRALQEKLRADGYYKGPIDGKAGPGTLDAMQKRLEES